MVKIVNVCNNVQALTYNVITKYYHLTNNTNDMNNLIILKAKKVKVKENGYTAYKTELYQGEKLMATIPISQRQPRKNQKTIMLNCWRYGLEW
jgi:hypothetical protein